MAELATIARPYAEALFKATAADLAATSAWLEPLAQVAANAQLQEFAANPNTKAAQVFDVLSTVAKVNLPEAGKNFLSTVIDNGRINALPEIAAQFRALKNAKSGSADALVHSAFPIEGAALADVSALLEKRFGRKLNVKVEIVPELIGGMRATVGDEVFDTSVKARLEQMKTSLMA
ncbi:MAG: F0F1 ATP synthase subunit delta [Brachymonas sp.]|nr:F0F1 ATP synthase subunit delta [Brachymonas sp.]NJS35678.1 F0F1 ATP synthase subunit delta [Brachymonas sp.]